MREKSAAGFSRQMQPYGTFIRGAVGGTPAAGPPAESLPAYPHILYLETKLVSVLDMITNKN